jgi:tRNA-dihydrouridine synthase B
MIGRAAQGRPWIFREINAMLAGDAAPRPPTTPEVRDIMLAHLRDLYEFYGPVPGARIARKHIGWYCAERPHAGAFRRAMMQSDSADTQYAMAGDYFDSLTDASAAAA